jgi:MFS family permease
MFAVFTPLAMVFTPLVALAALYFILPILAPMITAAAGLEPEDYGWIAGAIGLGSAWFYTANQAITPVIGPVRTLRIGMLVAVIGAVLMLSGHIAFILVGAVMIGFGYATTTPAGSQILSDFTPRPMWGRLFSLRQTAVPIGGMIAAGIASLFVADYGWRTTLEFVALVCTILAVALLLAPARYNESRPLRPFAAWGLFAPANIRQPFRTVRAVPYLGSLAAAGIGFAVVHGAVTTFFVTYLFIGVGTSHAQAATLFLILQCAGILGRILFGMIADRIGSPSNVMKMIAPLSALSALVLAVLPENAGFSALVAISVVIGLSVGTWNGVFLAEIARIAPARQVSDATAAAGFFSFTTYMLTPPAFAAIARTWGYRVAFAMTALAAATAGIIMVLRRAPVIAEQQT